MHFSYWRPLVLAMLLVVASFVATLWYTHYRTRKIEIFADNIAFNAEPSIAHLASARAQLQKVAVAVDMYFEATQVGDAPAAERAHSEIAAARQAFDAEFAVYAGLPVFPGEREVAAQVAPWLKLLDQRIADGLARKLGGTGVLTHEHSVYEALAGLDSAIDQLSQFNARQTAVESKEIESTRASGATIAFALGATSVGLAVIATVLAFTTMRRQARLIGERNTLMEVRATELEAFAGRVAHDLKNPLAAMSLRLSVAERAGGDSARNSFTRLHQLVRSMTGVVDGLLEFAVGGARPQPGASSNLAQVIDEVAMECRPAAEAASVALRVECEGSLWVGCSRGALTSLVANLVRNAVKYVVEAQRSEWRVTVRCRTHGEFARVEVDDNGPGIPDGAESRVFEPFVRLHSGAQSGIGLGLATVKRIVDAHHGLVGVARREQGSQFWFELPRIEGASPEMQPPA